MILIFSKFLMDFYKNNQNDAILKIIKIKELPRQIYGKLPKVSLKSFNSWKNLIQFHTHLFEDLKDLALCFFVNINNKFSQLNINFSQHQELHIMGTNLSVSLLNASPHVLLSLKCFDKICFPIFTVKRVLILLLWHAAFHKGHN